jgi:hypothetical protein
MFDLLFGRKGKPAQKTARRRLNSSFAIEQLESRRLLTVAGPIAWAGVSDAHVASVTVSTTPDGYSPAQIRHAYGFDQIVGTGLGQTIGIVDAYNHPNIANDLAVFDSKFGLPGTTAATVSSFLTKVGQNGSSTSIPKTDAGWAMEIALDVEWAHAIAPAAKILLVEASSNSISDLMTAVDYASSKATVVSMSWGGGEFSGEASYDYHFLRNGVTFVASSGDAGSPALWPSVSPNVVSVGGTSLYLNMYGNRVIGPQGSDEVAWSGSGGGPSAYESQPTYQGGFASSTNRVAPDLSYDADPNTGFSVYDTVPFAGKGGWLRVGGTSAGAPQIAGLVAIADQLRGGAGSLDGVSQTLPVLYSMATTSNYTSSFHDITVGSNGYKAGAGYDLATGLGTPYASSVIGGLVNWNGPAATRTFGPGNSNGSGTLNAAATGPVATVTSGNLTVTDDTAANLTITQTGANSFTVFDGATPVSGGTFTGVTGTITVTTSSSDDTVTIDLGNFTAPSSISVNLGDGANSLTVKNGTITGYLFVQGGGGNDTVTTTNLTVNGNTTVYAGAGDNNVTMTSGTMKGYLTIVTGSGIDTVVLGDGATALTVQKSVIFSDGGSPDDSLDLKAFVTIVGTLYTYAVNTVTMEQGSEIQSSIVYWGGYNVANNLWVGGVVDNYVYYYGSSGVDELDVIVTATIGRSVYAYMGAGDDIVDVDGTISASLYVDGGDGNDTVTLGATSLIVASSAIYLDAGNDTLNVYGSIGLTGSTASRLTVDAGSGNDTVALRSGSAVNGLAQINMGAGDDQFAVDDAATFAALFVNGGSGSDSFYGNTGRSGLVQVLFESFSAGPPPF